MQFFYRGNKEGLQQSDLKDETRMWSNVDDFRWLRAVSSAKWSVLPKDDRLPLVDNSDLKAEERIYGQRAQVMAENESAGTESRLC